MSRPVTTPSLRANSWSKMAIKFGNMMTESRL